MIKNNNALSMIEVIEYIKKDKEINTELIGFIKKFLNLNLKKSKELKEEIENLNLMKIKKEDIVKIIDLMPESAEDLNKIFVDVNLDEDETKKILDTIRKFK
jgi:DNA-directed RNA polymerase subunit F